MRDDKYTKIVKCDKLILKLGLVLLQKLGARRSLDISVRMRELARVLNNLMQQNNNAANNLDSFINGANFDNVFQEIEFS